MTVNLMVKFEELVADEGRRLVGRYSAFDRARGEPTYQILCDLRARLIADAPNRLKELGVTAFTPAPVPIGFHIPWRDAPTLDRIIDDLVGRALVDDKPLRGETRYNAGLAVRRELFASIDGIVAGLVEKRWPGSARAAARLRGERAVEVIDVIDEGVDDE